MQSVIKLTVYKFEDRFCRDCTPAAVGISSIYGGHR